MQKIVQIEVIDTEKNSTEGQFISADIRFYYTRSNLGVDGDGDVDDPEDLDESTLNLYCLMNDSWMRISVDLDWVFDVGVNTFDQKVYGLEYGGYVFASMSHLLIFGIAGSTYELGNYTLSIGPVKDKEGNIIEGASVTLLISQNTFISQTGDTGLVSFDTSRLFVGVPISIMIEKEGYSLLIFNTSLYLEGRLVDQLPSFSTVPIMEIVNFTLMIGPILDQGGEEVSGAIVYL